MAIIAFVAAADPPFNAMAADHDSGPMLCEDNETIQAPGGPQPTPAVLAGLYRCSGEGITISLRLDADGRFEQRFEADKAVLNASTDDEMKELPFVRAGRWQIEGNALHLFARPVHAPIVTLIDAKRDPSVRMRVEIRQADGKPASGIAVVEGEAANSYSELEEGIVLVSKDAFWAPGRRWIVRMGDDLKMFGFDVGEAGPNSFHFRYEPSEIEPFEDEAYIADPQASAIGVAVGTGGALLHRVGFTAK
ncbi:MAG: hypothetical protein EOP89_16590 [Lysobacteraceae bacterium]|nr:MAG: hypothetical protein EOP89_16590 [Xanthomonadaceae bacterium]